MVVREKKRQKEIYAAKWKYLMRHSIWKGVKLSDYRKKDGSFNIF